MGIYGETESRRGYVDIAGAGGVVTESQADRLLGTGTIRTVDEKEKIGLVVHHTDSGRPPTRIAAERCYQIGGIGLGSQRGGEHTRDGHGALEVGGIDSRPRGTVVLPFGGVGMAACAEQDNGYADESNQ